MSAKTAATGCGGPSPDVRGAIVPRAGEACPDDQLSLLDSTGSLPSRPVDRSTAEILTTVAGDRIHADDARRVVEAIRAAASENDGAVHPNGVRRRLTDDHGQIKVHPNVIGATYSMLARRGYLAVDGWVISDDRRGRNSGKPIRRWRWTGPLSRGAGE